MAVAGRTGPFPSGRGLEREARSERPFARCKGRARAGRLRLQPRPGGAGRAPSAARLAHRLLHALHDPEHARDGEEDILLAREDGLDVHSGEHRHLVLRLHVRGFRHGDDEALPVPMHGDEVEAAGEPVGDQPRRGGVGRLRLQVPVAHPELLGENLQQLLGLEQAEIDQHLAEATAGDLLEGEGVLQLLG